MTHTPDVAGEGLKPCPFCGSAAAFVPRTATHGMIVLGCTDSDCIGHQVAFDFVSDETAIAAWNRRPSPAIPDREEIVGLMAHAYRCAWAARACVDDDRADGECEPSLADYLSGPVARSLLAKLEGKS